MFTSASNANDFTTGKDPAGSTAVINDMEANGEKHAKPHLKAALRYGIAAAGCILFALVYAQFSHGVYSPFMTFMFTVPLAGGVLPNIVMHVAKASPLPVATRQAWALAVASLTVASCLKGVFDIAGTASMWLAVYLVMAVAFAVVALIAYAKNRKPDLQAC